MCIRDRDITVCLKEIPRLPYWLQLKLADNITLLENHNIRLLSLIHISNENQPYSAIEQAKTDRKPVFVRNRNSSICRKCSTNQMCIRDSRERICPLMMSPPSFFCTDFE